MALLFMDGFGHVDDPVGVIVKWDLSSRDTWLYYAVEMGRNGGWGFYINEDEYIVKHLPNPTSVIVGAAISLTNLSDAGTLVALMDGGIFQISLRFALDGSIRVYRGTTLIGSTASGLISVNTWYYLELKIIFSATVGDVEIRLNETAVLTLTDQNTSATGNSYCTGLRLQGNWSSGVHKFDDLYICDTTGTTNNDFLGDVQIKTLYPAADGNYSDFIPSTGIDNYAVVDDPQLLNTDEDYTTSTVVGAKDTFIMTTLEEGTFDILGVQVTAAVANSDKGIMSVCPMLRSGAVPADTEGVSTFLSQTVRGAIYLWEKEPIDDAVWNVASINASEFGIKIKS